METFANGADAIVPPIFFLLECTCPFLFKMWLVDRQCQYHLGVYQQCRLSGPRWTYKIRICILTRAPSDLCTKKSLKSSALGSIFKVTFWSHVENLTLVGATSTWHPHRSSLQFVMGQYSVWPFHFLSVKGPSPQRNRLELSSDTPRPNYSSWE